MMLNKIFNMKKASIIVVFFIISVGLFSCIRGNSRLITTEQSVSSFEGIDIRSSADVNYYPSSETKVIVTVDENLLKYVKITVKNGILRIDTKNGNYSFSKYTVDVYSPHLTEATISGSGSFDGKDKIVATNFETKISGSGKIKGNFDCDKFTATISGSGKIDCKLECTDFNGKISGSGEIIFSGNTNNLDMKISGSGDFKGKSFKTDNADINVSGSGNVHTWVENYLKAHVSGSGNIYYSGNPKIDFNGSGSGKLRSES